MHESNTTAMQRLRTAVHSPHRACFVRLLSLVSLCSGYSRADRKLSSRTPISAADVAIMLEEVSIRASTKRVEGVRRSVNLDRHALSPSAHLLALAFVSPRMPS